MSQETRTQLKTYFETGDIPTEAQFINLIDSLLNITDDGELVNGESGIDAHVGGGQGSAYQLTKRVNMVDAVASDHDSVKLPEPDPGMILIVYMISSNILDVYPASGDYINKLAVNIPVEMVDTEIAIFSCHTASHWNMILYNPQR